MEMANRQRKYVLQSLVYFTAIMLFAHIASAALTATPSPFTLSNTIIDVGQISVANTVVSGGSSGPYFGQWTWISNNETGAKVANTIATSAGPYSLAFNPSGTLAYVTSFYDGNVDVINPSTNTIINTITVGSSPLGVAFNPSGTLAYVVNYLSYTVNVINPATNTVINTIKTGTNPTGVAFNPQGTLAYVTNYGSDTVNVINPSTNTVINTITVGSGPEGLAFNPSGTIAYIVNEGSGTVNVINVATNTVINTIAVGSTPYAPAFNPQGTIAYVPSGSDTVNVIDVATNTVINTIAVGSYPIGVSFNPSGTLAYVSNDGSDTVSVINTATNTVINAITVGTTPFETIFNPKANLAYTVNYDSNTISVIDTLSSSSALQPLPASNTLQLTINAISGNELALSFNGINYGVSTGTNTIYGSWHIYGFASDSNIISGSDTGLFGQTFYGIGNTLISSNTLTINPSLSSPSISLTNNVIDSSQVVNISSSWSGGTVPYTIKWYTGPSGNTCAEDSANVLATYSGLSVISNSISVSPTTTNSYCAEVTDSATTPVTQSSSNDVVTVNPMLSIPTISPLNPTVGSGQNVTFSSTWSGGSPAYSAFLYSSQTSSCGQQSNLVQNIIGLSSGTVTFSPVTISASTYYCIVVSDSAGSYSTQDILSTGVSYPEGVAFSPSGTYAYLSNDGSHVVIINTATNTVTGSIQSSLFSSPQKITFSPSGTYAYITNCNSSCGGTVPDNILVVNTAINAVTGAIMSSGFNSILGMAFSPSGTYAYVVNFGANNMLIINTATNTVVGAINSRLNSPEDVAFSPSGTYAYITNCGSLCTGIGNYPENISIISTASNTIIGVITSPALNTPMGVAFNPSGTYAYVVNYGGANVLIVNTTTNAVTGSIDSSYFNAPTTIALSKSGTYAYILDFNNVTYMGLGAQMTSTTSHISLKAASNQVSNPYAGGSTGFFGNLPGATTATTSVSSTTTTSATTIPVTVPSVTSSGTVQQICRDTSGYIVNYPSLNTTFNIRSGISSCFNITASGTSSNIPSLLNRSAIKAINYTFSNRNISANVTMHYRCSTPPSAITPFILRNGTWQEITPFTVNVAACTVTFAAPADPTIGLFNISNQTTSTTVATSTINATTALTTLPAATQQSSQGLIIPVIAIIVIVIAVIIYLATRKR
jgi:YVTN family beta-propeller protein